MKYMSIVMLLSMSVLAPNSYAISGKLNPGCTTSYQEASAIFRTVLGLNVSSESLAEIKPDAKNPGKMDSNRAQYWVKGDNGVVSLVRADANGAQSGAAQVCKVSNSQVSIVGCKLGICITTLLDKKDSRTLSLQFSGHADWNRSYTIEPSTASIAR